MGFPFIQLLMKTLSFFQLLIYKKYFVFSLSAYCTYVLAESASCLWSYVYVCMHTYQLIIMQIAYDYIYNRHQSQSLEVPRVNIINFQVILISSNVIWTFTSSSCGGTQWPHKWHIKSIHMYFEYFLCTIQVGGPHSHETH